MKFFYALFLSGLLAGTALAQNQAQVDSLKKLLNTDITDQQKVTVYNALAKAYQKTDSLLITRYASRAMALAQKIHDPQGRVDAQNIQSNALYHQGHYTQARQMATQALQMAQKNNYPQGRAESYTHIGKTYIEQGHYSKARTNLHKARKIFEQMGDQEGLAVIDLNVGNIYCYQGNYAQGLKIFRKAQKTFQQIGNQVGVANCYNNLAVIYKWQGKLSLALKFFQQSLQMRKKIGDKADIAYSYNNIGGIYQTQGNYPKALEIYQKSLQIQQQVGSRAGMGYAYSNLGSVYANQGRYPQALEMHQRSLQIRKKLGDQFQMTYNYLNMGNAYRAQGNYAQALEMYRQSLQIQQQIGNKVQLSLNYSAIGDTYLLQNKVTLAIQYLAKALAISRQMKEPESTASALLSLGNAYYSQKKYSKARQYLAQGMVIAQKVGKLSLISYGAEYLAKVYQATGQYQQALEHHILFKQMVDSLFNEKSIRKITQLESQYAFDQEKDSLRQQQARQKNHLQAHLAKEKIARRFQRWVSTLALLLLGLLAWFAGSVWRSRQHQRRLNGELQVQKEAILYKNAVLNENEEEIRQKADMIAEQRDALARTNQALEANAHTIEAQKSQLQENLHQLQELDLFKEQMVGMIAHDLKNPLQAIIGLSQVAITPHHQQTIHQSGQRMQHLIQNMLDTQKLKEAQMPVQPKALPLVEVVGQAIGQIQWWSQTKDIQIHHQAKEGLAVMADQTLLGRALVNLLHNAVAYTPAQGKVSVSYKVSPQHPSCLRISVTDTGVGIAPDQLAQVFEPYYHGHLRKSSTGLGLAFCKMALEAQGGHLGVESAPGQGSTFWLELPQAASVPASVSAPPGTPPAPPTRLSEAEQAQLRPYLEQLSTYSVYQTSKVKALMDQIKFDHNPRLAAWKNDLKNALYALSQTRYEELIALGGGS